jgi:hypothetical protein
VSLIAELGANRVVPDVEAGGREMLVIPENASREAVLKEVAGAFVPSVESLGVDAIELVKSTRKPVELCLDDQVVVISHQAIGVTFPSPSLAGTAH